MVTAIIYSEKYLQHKTGTHVESPERLVAIMKLIKKLDMLGEEDFTILEPRMATIEEIKLIHEEEMIDKAKKKAEQAKGGNLQYLDFGDTVVSEDSYDVSLLAAGGVITAADAVMDGKVKNAFALVRPPGHHANRYKSSGFCVFNNMAIMAEYLVKKRGVKKVAIFDIDLHHGNGTAEIFYDRNDVLFFSSHQDGRTQYPGSGFINEIGSGSGKGYTINVPLAPGARDDVVQYVFKEVIKPIFEQFKPEIILGSIGCDAHHEDPLSGLEFTLQGYGNYVAGFREIAEKYCEGRMILTLEGGYRVKNLAKCVVNILHVLAGKKMPYNENDLESGQNIKEYHQKLANDLKQALGPYWNLK
ncbi:MAG: histone deacetylase family protein [Promethearchaeota archaeon]